METITFRLQSIKFQFYSRVDSTFPFHTRKKHIQNQITIYSKDRLGLLRVLGMHSSSFPPKKFRPPNPDLTTFSKGPDRAINLEKISDLMEFFHDFIKDRDMFLGKKSPFWLHREMVEICLFVCLFVCLC